MHVEDDRFSSFDLGKLSKLKSGETLDQVQIGGAGSTNLKSPKFQLGKVQNSVGGSLGI